MSDNTELAVTTKVKGGGFSAALLAKVKGKDEMSASLQRAKSEGQMRFKVKGNKFYINQGKTETLLKDGKKPAREVLVVIHEAAVGEYAGSMQRQLSEPYNEKNPQWVPMGCWSNNGKAPDDDVWNKQSDLCEECPVRQECSLLRNIALSLYTPEQEVKDLMIFTTNYSSNSQKKNGEDAEELLFSLTGYLKFLSAQGIALHRVVTKLIIDLDSENEPPNNCKVLFQPAGVLDDDDPNMVAHVKWSEEQNLEDVVKVKQMKPVSDEKVGNDFGAEVEEAEEICCSLGCSWGTVRPLFL